MTFKLTIKLTHNKKKIKLILKMNNLRMMVLVISIQFLSQNIKFKKQTLENLILLMMNKKMLMI